ncbi:MAG: hypothetical protein WBL88_13615 [Nitrososphaeraceae archaeon]
MIVGKQKHDPVTVGIIIGLSALLHESDISQLNLKPSTKIE